MREQLVKTYEEYSSQFSADGYLSSGQYCSGLFMMSQEYVYRIKTKERL